MRIASGYDALVVLGCDVAVETVGEILAGTACRVLRGMTRVGVFDAAPRFRPPGTISLKKVRVTPVVAEGRD